MSRWLDGFARLASSTKWPEWLRRRLWSAWTARHFGDSFFYPTRLEGRQYVYGGVCGYSDAAVFTPLKTYEPEAVSVARALVAQQPESTVLDIGAHNGEWMMLLKSLSPELRIVCFEPFPQLAAFLRVLVQRNQFSGTTIVHSALDEKPGTVELHFAQGSTESASLTADFQSTFNKRLSVPATTLDQFVQSRPMGRVSLLKIDVEGSESRVLLGGRELLAKDHPKILLEMLHTENPAHLARQRETIALLTQYKYRFFRIVEGGRLQLEKDVTPDSTYRWTNYWVQ